MGKDNIKMHIKEIVYGNVDEIYTRWSVDEIEPA